MHRANRERGFTILELMMVVMIIGILTSIFVPMAKSYMLRSKISEAILAMGQCKTVITEIVLSAGAFPAADEWGCEANTVSNPTSNAAQYVKTISVSDTGVIKILVTGTGSLLVDNNYITMAPLDNTGNPITEGVNIGTWRCGSPLDGTEVRSDYLPNSCRGS